MTSVYYARSSELIQKSCIETPSLYSVNSRPDSVDSAEALSRLVDTGFSVDSLYALIINCGQTDAVGPGSSSKCTRGSNVGRNLFVEWLYSGVRIIVCESGSSMLSTLSVSLLQKGLFI